MDNFSHKTNMGLFSKLFGVKIKKRLEASANEIPQVISQLQQSGQDGNFAVFIFASKDGEDINLQYSIEGGVIGFDWVLVGVRNIADKTIAMDFAAKLGFPLEEREMNEVRYLRLTGSGISELGAGIIHDLYHIDRETKIGLVAQGFDWPP